MPILSPVEKAEGFEMIRFLENSCTVNMIEVQDEAYHLTDTQKDLKRVKNYLDVFKLRTYLQQKLKKNNLQSEEIFHFEHSPRRLQGYKRYVS